MAVYQFESATGKVLERNYPMSKAPRLGKMIREGGVDYRRVLSRGAGAARPMWKPYISNRLPRNLHDIECDGVGRPIISSQAVERKAAAIAGGGSGAWKRD